ncbi:MAG TPA: LuxR family transcriptional regulator [Mycoplana sp.]|nr:LuxR family transcriptional regulator [Mycoplana sp.]
MNINLLAQFTGLLDELSQRDEILSEFERLLDRYGFDYYGVLRQPKPHDNPMTLVLAGRWPPKWPETYIRKKYIVIDPTILYLGHAHAGFRWRDTIAAFRSNPHRKRMERMMVDARNNGLEDGYIFPVHGRRGLLGILTLGGKAVDLHPAEVGLFDSVAKRLFWKLLAVSDPERPTELSAGPTIHLTRREMEALSYLADGMTSHEIARVLSISNHTVDWYMNGIQEKLQAKNRHHAVALSFRLGLIS